MRAAISNTILGLANATLQGRGCPTAHRLVCEVHNFRPAMMGKGSLVIRYPLAGVPGPCSASSSAIVLEISDVQPPKSELPCMAHLASTQTNSGKPLGP